jgi:hypothetical protein
MPQLGSGRELYSGPVERPVYCAKDQPHGLTVNLVASGIG